MAQLKFSGIQPVAFGNRECTPHKLNTGERLRLERISFDSDANEEKADEQLAKCFDEDDQSYVLDFLANHMTPTDKNLLKSYLLEGEKAIAMLDRVIDATVEKNVKSQEAAND